MDYIIKKTDIVGNGQFTIKPYTTNGPAFPSAATPLATNAVSANTSLILLGKGMYEYGELVASDFVHLLENFSNSTAPVYPIQGQLWYKNTTKELFIYDNGDFVTQKVIINGLLTTNLDVNGRKVINLAPPTDPNDAITKQYLEGYAFTVNGGALTSGANITFSGGGQVLGLPDTPVGNNAATSKLYVDTIALNALAAANAAYVYKSGDVMTGTLTMSNNGHIYLPTPSGGFVTTSEVVNKDYVDTAVGGGGVGVFVRLIGDTITGQLAINGINLYSGVSRNISAVDTVLSTITLSGGDYTLDFSLGKQFSVVFNAVSGYQIVDVGGTITGGTLTNLVPGTTYTASILLNGVTTIPISFLGSAATDYTALVSELNTALGVNALADITTGNLRITSALTGSSSSVVITPDTLFAAPLANFVAVLAAVPGVNSTIETLTTSSSSHNVGPNTTSVIVSNVLTTTASSGVVNAIPGLTVYSNAITKLSGDLIISGSHTIDMGGNYVTNVNSPVNVSDAATKSYVDTLVAGASVADGTLLNGSYNNLTHILSLVSTVGSPVLVDLIDLANANHTHIDNTLFHNIRAPNTAIESRFRRSISTPTQPKVSVSDIFDLVSTDLSNLTQRNERYITPVVTYTITDVSSSHADLTVVSVTTGMGSTVTLGAGDYTTTFKLGVQFNINDNTGAGGLNSVIPLTTISSTFNVGPNTTTVTVLEILPGTITNDGVVKGLNGAYKITGDHTLQFNSSYVRFNVIGNIGGGNGNFIVGSASYTSPDTWIYAYRTTVLPIGATGNGTIQLYGYILPFYYKVEANKLLVFDNGIKQYRSSRCISYIYNTLGFKPISIQDTTLINGTYSLNLSLDGAANQLVSIVVNHPFYTVTTVDMVHNKITVSGLHAADFFEFEVIHLSGNTGVGTAVYTIVSATEVSGNTEIIIAGFPVGGVTNDGVLRQPYEYQHLLIDLDAAMFTIYGPAADIWLEDGNILIVSDTSGTLSSVYITDVNLIAALPSSAIFNAPNGIEYTYSETGPLLSDSRVIDFVNLPIIGNVLEFINTR